MENNYTYTKLSYEELVENFIQGGMLVKDKNHCAKKLENIGYYTLKDFALPYTKLQDNGLIYEAVYLEHIISRFYSNKNLRVYLLHALEKIEDSLINKVISVLGEKIGSFGYLEFENWVDKTKFSKEIIKTKEDEFKINISKKIEETNNFFIKEFLENHPNEKFIPIWLLIEILTCKDIIMIYNLMTNDDKIKISDFYSSTTSELDSWLPHFSLLKDLCVNKDNIIDIEFETLPLIRDYWKINLYHLENRSCTNKLGISLVILKFFISQISSDYFWGNIGKSLQKLMKAKTTSPNMYGLVDRNVNFLLDTNNFM